MKRYTNFLDTGSDRAALYNHRGDNLTDGLPGAGTDMVGGWSRDFSALFLEDFGIDQTNAWPSYTNELSFIVADGRLLHSATLQQESDPYAADFDDDDEPDDRHSIVQAGEDYVGIRRLHIRLMAAMPDFTDAGMWLHSGEDGSMTYSDTLAAYLDAELAAVDEGGDVDSWQRRYEHLRVPLHWRLYKVPVASTGAPKLATMVASNSATPTVIGGQLAWGPYGMLKAMYGREYAADHQVRLWDQDGSLPTVARGESELTFTHGHMTNTTAGPNERVDIDVLDVETTHDPIYERNSVLSLGRNYHLVLRTGRFIEVKPDELLVFQASTGRARLSYVAPAGGAPTHSIMGPVVPTDPDEGEDTDRLRAGGPMLAWYGWQAGAWYYDSRPRRSRRRGRR